MLRAYSYRDLQMFSQMLAGVGEDTTAAQLSATVTRAMEELDRYLTTYVDEQTVLGTVLSMRGQMDPCPTDGCPGHLEPWPKSSAAAGVPIVGCLLCRYSRMDGGR